MISGDCQPSAYFPVKINKSQETQQVVPLQFPSTRNILWETKCVGDLETLSLTLPNQDVQLFIVEKCLRLAHRYSEGRQVTSFLLGSVYPKSDDGGVCFGVDRFDPGREVTDKLDDHIWKYKVPTAVVPGDHVIPIKIKNEILSTADSVSHTKEEFHRALQIIKSKICGKDVLSLSHTMSLKANIYCSKEENELTLNLHCGAIVPDVKFQAIPIAPLPIIPTALARNLAGPLRLSDVQGTAKMGYITMDQTRKLLLLLESDPKVYGLPLIGIWITGAHSLHHPYVWASCLRFLNCSEIKDRVLHRNGSFLLLHYSIVQRMPNFWECCSESGENLKFNLLSCQEKLVVDLEMSCAKDPLCFQLSPAVDGMNKTLFDKANNEFTTGTGDAITTRNLQDNTTELSNGAYDANPRPSPSPHPSPTQGKSSLPPVPEDLLSLSIDELSSNINQQQHISQNNNGDGNIFASRFDIPAKQQQHQTVKKSKNFLEPRAPLKPIISLNQAQNIFHDRVKLNTPNRTRRSKENKENTPVTSRSSRHSNHRQRTTDKKTCEVVVNENCYPDNRIQKCDNKTDNLKKSTPMKDFQNTSNENSARITENYGDDLQQNICSQNQFLQKRCLNKPRVSQHDFVNKKHIGDISASSLSGLDISCDKESLSSGNINAVSPNYSFTPNSMHRPSDPERPAHHPTPKQQSDIEQTNSQKGPQNVEKVNEERSLSKLVLQDKPKNKCGSEKNRQLEEQVKKQEHMIRILQEQVRSLLKTKEEISSCDHVEPYLPLTPASTPEQSNGGSVQLQTRKHVEDNTVSNSAVQTDNTSKQCGDDGSRLNPGHVTIGVNTGASLLWDNPQKQKSPCAQCCDCHRSTSDVDQQLNITANCLTVEDKVLTPDKTQSLLFEVSEVDIKNETTESLPNTVDAVDIPSFVDSSSIHAAQSCEKQQDRLSLINETGSSRAASQITETAPSEQYAQKTDTPLVKGKEYYDQLLYQVKDLLNERIGDENASLQGASETMEPKQQDCLPTREGVIKATMRELENIKNAQNDGAETHSSVSTIHQRSLSTSFIPDHLRFNYVSMVADETFDEMTYVDEIALKYLSDQEIQEYKQGFHPKTATTAATSRSSYTRTVRFGSLPNNERRSSRDTNNLREIDFTWNNLSICTKNYLTKYNLVEGRISMGVVEQNQYSEPVKPQVSQDDPCKAPFPSPTPKSPQEKHEILDIQRLKKLPKLF